MRCELYVYSKALVTKDAFFVSKYGIRETWVKTGECSEG